MSSKQVIYVGEPKYQELCKVLSTSEISEHQRVRGTVLVHSKEYVVTSAMGTETGIGWASLWGYEVVELGQYEGTLPPLRYHDHFYDAHLGRRERSYCGLMVDHGKRVLVLIGERVEFRSSGTGQQISLF